VKRKLGISDATTPARKGATSSPGSTPTKANKVVKTPTKSRGGRKKPPVKKEESESEEDTNVKTEVKSENRSQSVKREANDPDDDPSAQLQADMDAMMNRDPF
jgi:hypothetical protein